MISSHFHTLEAAAGAGDASAARGAAPGSAADREPAAQPMPTAFEPALAELEQIVARMEAGELSLEQSLADYQRGAQLLQFCQSALKDAQQQVKILEAGLLQDFTGDVGQD